MQRASVVAWRQELVAWRGLRGSRLDVPRTTRKPRSLTELQGSVGVVRYPRLADALGAKLTVLEPSSLRLHF